MQNHPNRTQTKFSFVQFVKAFFQGGQKSTKRVVNVRNLSPAAQMGFDALFNEAFGTKSNVSSFKTYGHGS